MNIKTASEKTGLTKKAIKYYEVEGLITPLKNDENNYREYNDHDIVRLNLIASLRLLDIPIREVKNLLDSEKSMLQIMKEALNRIDMSIENLERSRLIINTLIENHNTNNEFVGEQVKRLKENLELSIDEKKEYISETLLRIFPANMGKFLVMNYEPFLNITLDSEEKKKGWVKLVEFLDDLSDMYFEIETPDNFNMVFDDNYKKKRGELVKNLLNGDLKTREEMKAGMIKVAKVMSGNEEARKYINEYNEKNKSIFMQIDGMNKSFDKLLGEVNEDYLRYNNIIEGIRKEIHDEVEGFMDFMPNLSNQ